MHRDQDQERHINSVQTSQMFYKLEAHLLKWILHLQYTLKKKHFGGNYLNYRWFTKKETMERLSTKLHLRHPGPAKPNVKNLIPSQKCDSMSGWQNSIFDRGSCVARF